MGNNEYYEQVLRVITTLDNCELKAFILNGHKWYEIDDIQDKNIAETIFSATAKERLSRIQSAYGGYWRFPGMLDFCYLVNPCFPTAHMYSELKAYFTDLISSYPSGLNTQNLLAAKLFNIDEKHILAGNGAAELIRGLSSALKGPVGVTYPTFNEYPESFASEEIVSFIPSDFSYTKDDILEFSKKCSTLILINPDNPSGNYIAQSDVLEIAADFKSKGKTLILDESFADFSDADENPSLISENIIEEYPNLIVIKSLSKSYGIPGIRLGVLACSDESLIKKVRAHLSIWNINSFGEYFMQIIGKYRKEYRYSCEEIAAERKRFGKLLEQTGILRVYPSQANYFLCKITAKYTAAELAELLLDKYDIFIKDLTGKKGIPGNSFIRLAVRNSRDNDILAKTLGEL
jgi:histidinol-phosphate/aromatic aminotransferase/cobyric acid decarboxylase-like protein